MCWEVIATTIDTDGQFLLYILVFNMKYFPNKYPLYLCEVNFIMIIFLKLYVLSVLCMTTVPTILR